MSKRKTRDALELSIARRAGALKGKQNRWKKLAPCECGQPAATSITLWVQSRLREPMVRGKAITFPICPSCLERVAINAAPISDALNLYREAVSQANGAQRHANGTTETTA